MSKKGVPSSLRNHQMLVYLLATDWHDKKRQEKIHKLIKQKHPDKKRFLDFLPIKNFQDSIAHLRSRFGIPLAMDAKYMFSLEGLRIDRYKKTDSPKIKYLWWKESRNKSHQFISSLSKDSLKNLNIGIKWLINTFGLNFTWYSCILDILIQAYYYAPDFNLVIIPNKKKKKFFLKLTGTTSLEDIKYAWETIAENQKEIFGNKKRKNFSRKKNENITLYKDFLKKQEELLQEKVGLNSFNNQKVKHIDIIANLFPEEEFEDISIKTDKKRTQRLRTIKTRFKHGK